MPEDRYKAHRPATGRQGLATTHASWTPGVPSTPVRWSSGRRGAPSPPHLSRSLLRTLGTNPSTGTRRTSQGRPKVPEGIANGYHRWLTPMSTTGGGHQRVLSVWVTGGCHQWMSPMGVTAGCNTWVSPVGVNTGCHHKVSPNASTSTGISTTTSTSTSSKHHHQHEHLH